MKMKRFISLLLALTLVFGSLQAMCGFAASAINYDATVLSYMIENPTSYRADRYTEDSFAFYTAAFAAAEAVNSNPDATAAEINAAVADLAAAEAALTYVGTPYHSALNLRTPDAVVLAQTAEFKFKDAMSNELSNITVTAEYANITNFVLEEDGFYTATVTATGATGSTATITVSYDLAGETYTFKSYFMVVATAPASTTNKAQLGALLALENARNRQANDYSGGFLSYQSVIKASTLDFINSTTTQTRIDRAVSNIGISVNGLVSAYADYSEIYALVAQANELDPDNYDSFTAVNQALSLIVYDYPADQQSVVDAMAEQLRNAIAGLTLKVSRYTVKCVYYNDDDTETVLSETTYDGTRTYRVRITAPVFPGFESEVEYQSLELTEDEHFVTFVYTPVTYYAYFNANGGQVSIESKELKYDTEYGELPVATRDGYSFLGWFSDPVAGEQIFAETMVTVNYVDTLYAHWSDVETYTFNFDAGLGSACDSITASYGDEIEMPVPQLYGYSFVGWFYEDDSPASYTTMPDVGADGDSVTLYAKYTEAVYDITLDAGEGTVADSAYEVKYGSAYGDIPAAVREGYTFTGWFTQPEGGDKVTSATVVELDSTHTLYAQYTVNTYTLAFDMAGGDAIASVTAEYGTPIEIPQPNRMYYIFAGWTLDGNEFELTTMPAAATPGGTTTITAVWTLNTHVSYYLDAYKTVNGARVPATSIKAGDELEIEVSLKTNFGVGQCVFAIVYDNRVFAVNGTAATKYAVFNTASGYAETLGTKAMLNTNKAYPTTNWAKYFEDDDSTSIDETDPIINKTDFSMFYTKTPQFKTTNTPVALTEKTHIFTLHLKVNSGVDTNTITDGIIAIDSRVYRSPENGTAAYPGYVTNQRATAAGAYTDPDTFDIIGNYDNARLELPFAEEDIALVPATGSTTVVDYTEGYIYGLAEKLTLDVFKSDYATLVGNGTIECEDTVLKTGSVIKVMSGTTCLAQYTVIIYGDINSDGVADGNDSFLVNMIDAGMLSADSLTAAQKLAADPNHDGAITAADALLLEDAGLLEQVVSQVPKA